MRPGASAARYTTSRTRLAGASRAVETSPISERKLKAGPLWRRRRCASPSPETWCCESESKAGGSGREEEGERGDAFELFLGEHLGLGVCPCVCLCVCMLGTIPRTALPAPSHAHASYPQPRGATWRLIAATRRIRPEKRWIAVTQTAAAPGRVTQVSTNFS